jgi:hypothetical protein
MREMNNENMSMLGRDAHMNIIYAWTLLQSYMSIVWSSFHHIFYERVHKRTHEPRSTFNHKKQLANHFIIIFIFTTY